jgi:hypothetical protein
MDNVKFIEIETLEGLMEYAIIDRGNGEFTSMTKEYYDTLVSNSSTPQAGN